MYCRKSEEEDEEQIYQYVTCYLGIIDWATMLRRPTVPQWKIELEMVEIRMGRRQKTQSELRLIQLYLICMIRTHKMIRSHSRTQLHHYKPESLMLKVRWTGNNVFEALSISRAIPTTLSSLTPGWQQSIFSIQPSARAKSRKSRTTSL